MKTLKIFAFISSLVILLVAGCTKDFEEINTDPNNSVAVETAYILTYAEKNMMDNLRDLWYGGRCTQVLAQHWSQRNYSDEDRYLFRTTVTNNAWRAFYRTMMNLEKIIELNTNESTKSQARGSGPNEHQIAIAKTLQVWIMSIITDTWGDVPYSEAFKSAILQPKYDKQEDVYAMMIAELKAAADLIDANETEIVKGDIIYGGDAAKWKKLANSLRLRLALRVRHKNPAYFNEVIALPATSFFQSNADNAAFTYLPVSPNEGPVYRGFFVDARNDFTISKPLVEVLAGRNDTLNAGKLNPFVGVVDPRIDVFMYPDANGKYVGMPYGMNESMTKQFAQYCPNYFITPSVVHQPDFSYIIMDYAEVCFIFSEANSWAQSHYENGIVASMQFWGVDAADIDAYIAAIPAANEENVMTQKYIAFYMQPEQAWFEYRRKGYPKMLISPGEITHNHNGQNVIFEPLEGNAIPRRLQYPIEEQGVNKSGYDGAIVTQGQDVLSTRVWWDKP